MAGDGATCYAEAIMETRVKVVLYGDTLVLAGLQASLATYAGLDVLCLAAPLADEQDIYTLRPDVVIVDAAAVPCPPFRLLSELPSDLLLVSVDAATNRVQVWSGQQMSAASTRDLVALIAQRSPPHWNVASTVGA
jgi:hypothetical protein